MSVMQSRLGAAWQAAIVSPRSARQVEPLSLTPLIPSQTPEAFSLKVAVFWRVLTLDEDEKPVELLVRALPHEGCAAVQDLATRKRNIVPHRGQQQN